MSEEKFCETLGLAGEEAKLAGAMRNGFSVMCCVPPEKIHPHHSIDALERLTSDGWFPSDFLMGIEDVLGYEIPWDDWEKTGVHIPLWTEKPSAKNSFLHVERWRDIGEYIVAVAETIAHELAAREATSALPKSTP